jgi:multicomponent Na+:H+ antiporter subunit E
MRWLRKLWLAAVFIGFYLWEVVLSSLRMAADIVRPRPRISPGFIMVPLEARTDLEILLVTNLISFTPGTLSVQLSADHRQLCVHTMYATDADELARSIRLNLERRVLEVLR